MAPPDTFPRQAYSVEQAAAALGISRRTAFRHVASGELNTTKLGRRRLVPVSEIERLTGMRPPAPSEFANREDLGSLEREPATPPLKSRAPAERLVRPNLSDLLVKVTEGSVER
jgi:excisionase family DNA binding protein